jgi:subtilisin family serine protease
VAVKSAGNKGPGPETISAPGQFSSVTAVAAVDKDSQIAAFSSRGPSPLPHTGTGPLWKPDVSAPGVDVISSVPGNKYAAYSGTSMAQPHYSGAALAVLSKFPHLTPEQVADVLSKSARDLGARDRDLEFGTGLIQLPAALEYAAKRYPAAQ